MKKGVLLINLGTPEKPDVPAVRAYLKEFLMDPYVLDIPYLFRWLLVHFAILPKRPAPSAAAYRKIWTDRGSPLLYHHLDLGKKVQQKLGEEWVIQPVMRYGAPSLEKGVRALKEAGVSELLMMPLYPQYSLAATESSLQYCDSLIARFLPGIKRKVVEPFFQEPKFIQSFTDVAGPILASQDFDHFLFSFHGLPERQIKRVDPSGHCFAQDTCCDRIENVPPKCYRAQCFRTAHLMAEKLRIPTEKYTVCFQSRLGRTPWIRPFTDDLYRDLPKRGIKRIAVFSPAFVADCLETLEEIQIRGREDFIRRGGEELRLIPSLNSEETWVNTVASWILDSNQR